MKKDDDETMKDEASTSKENEPQPSTSTAGPSSPDSVQDSSKDALFEPTVEMMVNDFDDEQTLEEEERAAENDGQDPNAELSDLQRESEMPIEELLKLYGRDSFAPTSSTGTSRKRRRRTSPRPEKSEAEVSTSEGVPQPSTSAAADEIAEESPDEDATTTTTANNLENQSLDDDTMYEEDEPSELKKLYTGYSKDGLKLESLSDEEADDLDYSPEEDETKKTIMVGGDYQATIPEGLCKYDDVPAYENDDKLIWDPSKLKDNEIEDYLQKFAALASSNGAINHIPPGGKNLRDDEQALHILLQCGNNCEEALRRRQIGGVQPSTSMSIWSEEECKNFESGIRQFGKYFHEIQASKVKTRSVGECVQFYYLWKKTERHDLFANKARLEKKKYNLNPCSVDVMDKYLEELDNSANRDRSASPNVNNSNSLLLADSKHRLRSDPSANNSEKSTSEGGTDVKNE